MEQLAAALDATAIDGLDRLSGGASRETWRFDAVHADGRRDPLVLRRDPPGRPGSLDVEARAIAAAFAAGLPVPEVLAGPDTAGGLVMRRIEGETIARRILRDGEYAPARGVLAEQCGRFLAGLHALDLDAAGLADLARPDPLKLCRANLELVGEASPTFELAFRWLDANRPAPPDREVVVHGDFRLGNLIVGPEGLRAVLDWELVHAGDPVEDLGWLCVKAWRFGAELPVGGFGTREQLLDAYRAAGGAAVDPATLRWWEVLNTLKWGVGCMGQAAAHLGGAARSVELAAIGRRVCEQEWDLLLLLAPDVAVRRDQPDASPTGDLHGRPTLDELLEAVAEFLRDDVMPGTAGRLSFHARVAANVVDTARREIALGPAQAARRAGELAGLGVESEAELAAAVRRGDLDDRHDELVEVLASGVVAKLAVANPRY
jgi:aminoglycoside phosphotransferase (APT) family kinase protein